MMDGVVVRAPRADESAAVTDLLNACSIDDIGTPDTHVADVERWWRQGTFDRETDAWVAVADDGRFAGFVMFESDGHGGDLSFDGYTHPEFRDRGIGSRLAELGERRAIDEAARHGLSLPVTVMHGAWGDSIGARFLEARGYRATRCFLHMRIDMDAPPAAPRWPEGIRVEGFERGRDEPRFHECIEEAFADHWNHTRRPLDQWVRDKIEGEPYFDGSLWFRAMDGESMVGAVVALARTVEDPGAGWVSDVAVVRPWRGRGIGLALLLHEFGALYGAGARAALLAVDADSSTGAGRVYERAGMRVVRRIYAYAKELR
jgi:mycothiol synthase